jgi:hypothetical protein
MDELPKAEYVTEIGTCKVALRSRRWSGTRRMSVGEWLMTSGTSPVAVWYSSDPLKFAVARLLCLDRRIMVPKSRLLEANRSRRRGRSPDARSTEHAHGIEREFQ